MTVNLTENKTELTSNQEKVDTKEIQQKIDNTTNEKVQQPIEDKNKEEAYEDPNFKAFREGRKKDRAAREAAEALAAQKEQEISSMQLNGQDIIKFQSEFVPDVINMKVNL